MALKLRITSQAKRDAGRILGYIAMDNPDAARTLANALERGIRRLLKYPRSAPLLANRIHPDIRQLIIPPCRILYRLSEEFLFIVGVMRCEEDLPETRLEGL